MYYFLTWIIIPAFALEYCERTYNLVDWVKRSGGMTEKIEVVCTNEENRSLRALKKIKINEEILRVPYQNLIISSEIALEPIQRMKQAGEFTDHLALIVALYLENDQYQPYIQSMALDQSTYPINYNAEQLAQLQGSYILELIARQKLEIQKAHKIITKYIDISNAVFQQLYLFVQSRAFLYKNNSSAIVPLGDLCQHSDQKKMSFKFIDQGFYFIANRDIEQGEELTFQYHVSDNQDFLIQYGFTYVENELNNAQFDICLDKFDSLYTLKVRLLGKECAHYKLERFQQSFAGPLAMFRLYVITKTEDLTQFQINMDNDNFQNPISIELEEKALYYLEYFFLSKLSQYKTSIEDDQIIIRDEQISQIQKDIATIVIREQQVYQYNIALVKLISEIIIFDPEQRKIEIKKQKYRLIREYARRYFP